MGIATYPAPSAGGGIKAVQRGSAASAGTVTITSVDITKSFVNVFGTASSGTVAATGAISAATGSTSTATQPVPLPYIFDGNANSWRRATNGQLSTASNGSGLTNAGNADVTNTGIVTNVTSTVNAMNISLNATNISGGTNNLVTATTQGYLSNSTSLVVSGACRWEVVEFA